MKRNKLLESVIKNTLSEVLFGNKICESIDDWDIVNALYEDLMLEKLLYGEPMSIEELRKILRNKIVNFEFVKLDGEIRPARGTTMMKYIPKEDHPKGVQASSDKVATFYDLDKKDWRSVSKRSKEVVLKKDDEKEKPVMVVKDKEKSQKEEPEGETKEKSEEEVDSKEEKTEEKTKEEPEKETPEEPEEPEEEILIPREKGEEGEEE